MLDWLKPILGTAYTEDIDKKVSDEIGKSFVSRADFNSKNVELATANATVKERDGQLDTLQKSTGDVTALKEQITTLQGQNSEQAKTHAAALQQIKVDSAVTLALAGAKAKNTRAVRALLELEKAELTEDGSIKGLADQIKRLTEADDSSFLFDTATKATTTKGLKLAEGGDKTPGTKTPKEMTYDEICAYMVQHPDAALE